MGVWFSFTVRLRLVVSGKLVRIGCVCGGGRGGGKCFFLVWTFFSFSLRGRSSPHPMSLK